MLGVTANNRPTFNLENTKNIPENTEIFVRLIAEYFRMRQYYPEFFLFRKKITTRANYILDR